MNHNRVLIRDMNQIMDSAAKQNSPKLKSVDEVDAGLIGAGYIPSRQISTAIYMAHHLQKPILVEGPAGGGGGGEGGG